MAKKRIQEIVDRLTVMDDTFFHKLVEDKGFCEELIQTVTGNKRLRLVEVAAQKSLRNIKGRSVVLDAYCVDAEHNHFNLEIQKKDDDDHQRRVRYNASNMDTYIAEKGTRFEHIPDSYVIYISKHDFWKKGRAIYHIDRVLRETGDVVDNGMYEIYVNTQVDDRSEVAELMKLYSSPEVPENEKFPKTCAGIKNLKVGKGSDDMCDIVEEYADMKAREAVAATARKTALCFLKEGLSVEQIARCSPDLSIDEVKGLQEELLQSV